MIKYNYSGFGNCPSVCGLDIFFNATGSRPVVMLTELDDNPGTSVTNAYEEIAAKLCHGRPEFRNRAIWIEHYPAYKGACEPDCEETYDYVELDFDEETIASPPKWTRITKEQFDAIVANPDKLGTILRPARQRQEGLENGIDI